MYEEPGCLASHHVTNALVQVHIRLSSREHKIVISLGFHESALTSQLINDIFGVNVHSKEAIRINVDQTRPDYHSHPRPDF